MTFTGYFCQGAQLGTWCTVFPEGSTGWITTTSISAQWLNPKSFYSHFWKFKAVLHVLIAIVLYSLLKCKEN